MPPSRGCWAAGGAACRHSPRLRPRSPAAAQIIFGITIPAVTSSVLNPGGNLCYLNLLKGSVCGEWSLRGAEWLRGCAAQCAAAMLPLWHARMHAVPGEAARPDCLPWLALAFGLFLLLPPPAALPPAAPTASATLPPTGLTAMYNSHLPHLPHPVQTLCKSPPALACSSPSSCWPPPSARCAAARTSSSRCAIS